jgi:hypothetical protein
VKRKFQLGDDGPGRRRGFTAFDNNGGKVGIARLREDEQGRDVGTVLGTDEAEAGRSETARLEPMLMLMPLPQRSETALRMPAVERRQPRSSQLT